MKKALFVLLLTLWGAKVYASATDVYVTQSGAGLATGTSLGNAFAITALSSGTNCGAAPTQIGPDTVVHISVDSSGSAGTANFSSGGTMFSLPSPCAGTSGHPITLQFKSGDVWQSPVFTDSPGAISITNRAFIVLDLNGATIQDTLNGHTGGGGTSAATCPAGTCTTHLKSVLIQSIQCNTCEIKGGTLANTYVTVACELATPPGCGVSGDANQNAIQYSGPGFKAHDLTMHDNTWEMLETSQATGDTVEIYNNNFYNMDHGVACGAASNTTVTFVKIHDNHFHDMQNFDTGQDDGNHHDGIHCFSSTTASKISDMYIYNNLFDGLQGQCCVTAWVFLEGGSGGGATPWTDSTGVAHIWNNVFIGTLDTGNGQLSVNAGTNHQIYNNIIIQTGTQLSGGKCFNARGSVATETINFVNNVMQGCAQALSMDGNVAIGTWNNNGYSNFTGGGNEIFNWTGHGGGSTNTLSAWRTVCSCDAGAVGGTAPNLLNINSSGVPQTGSILINASTSNLTSQATGLLASLQTDTTAGNSRTPTARPSSGNWTIGAYNAGGAPPPPPPPAPPPILLSVVVQ